jgi:TDG/mug DNA glycosylase family protein
MSFSPVIGENPKVLILGTMPGRRSLELNQYYANPGNVFWSIMGHICGAGPELPYPQRCSRLCQMGITLWDVLKYGERQGSLDSRIIKETEIPNDLDGFLQTYPTIRAVCFNGQKAFASFERLVYPLLSNTLVKGISLKTLPSTSPANARISKDEKLKAWRQALEPYLL